MCLRERSVHAERENLAALAGWAHALTSLVSIEPPDGLLLEVRGSLKLFGGIAAIEEKLAAELARRRLSFAVSAAPTPLAALWLARAARAAPVSGELTGRVSTLPLEVTRWPEDVRATLADMGVRTVGDCLRLPRDGFARRFGAAYLRELDKALGRQPDLRRALEIEPRASGRIEFSGEITQTNILASALRSLVTSLTADLRQRQRQVQSLSVVFEHARRPPTMSRLQLIESAHETHRLLAPLIVRLERMALPAPVIALRVDADALVPMRIDAPELFTDGSPERKTPVSRAALIEILRARLGIDGVYGLELVSEHRPERVWKKLTETLLGGVGEAAQLSWHVADRPLWILPAPLPLVGRAAELCREVGVGRGTAEPERIESGWWDGADVSRDYYAITTGQGQRVWVYEDCRTRDWYLHGIFG